MKEFFFIISIFLVIINSGCASKTSNTYKIGIDLRHPPFESLDSDGQPNGQTIKMVNRLCEHLDKKCEIVDLRSSFLIDSLVRRRIDLIVSSLELIKRKEVTIIYSTPYYKNQLVLVNNKEFRLEDIINRNITDLKVSVKYDTIGYFIAEKYFEKKNIIAYDNYHQPTQDMLISERNFMLIDYATFNYIKSNLKNNINLEYAFINDEMVRWCIAANNEDKDIINIVNKFLENYKFNGGD